MCLDNLESNSREEASASIATRGEKVMLSIGANTEG